MIKKKKYEDLKLRSWVIIFLISALYIGLSFVFNFSIWKQVFYRESLSQLTIQGESPIYEFVAEQVKNNILNFKNAFQNTSLVLYPFGWDYSLDDIAPINGFYFLFLRPFLSIHQSFMLIVLLSIYISNISMYALLRLLGISRKVSFLFGLVFGFSPFVALRIGGHPTYVAFYLFTLPAIFLMLLMRSTSFRRRFLYSALLGLSLFLVVLTNLYFAVMMCIMLALLVFFFLWYEKKAFTFFMKKYMTAMVASMAISVFLLIPWFIQLYKRSLFNPYIPPLSWVDSITFSADLFSVVWPSYFNPFYVSFVAFLNTYTTYRPAFESITYPGLITLASFILFFFFRKKLPRFIHVLHVTAFAFWVLSLGPFLQILGRNTSIPLPYVVINFIPYLQMARAPGRFIVPFIFLASICGAFLVNYLLERKYAKKARVLFFALLVLFLIDQTYYISKPLIVLVPNKLYSYLKTHNYKGPLLEVPFTIRDGLENLGSFDAVWSFRKHNRFNMNLTTFGIYAGRINPDTFTYYKRNALIRPLGHILESKITSVDAAMSQFRIEIARRLLDFYSVEYATLKQDERYSPIISTLFEKLSFREVLKQDAYTLYRRAITEDSFDKVKFGEKGDDFYLERGWSVREKGGRWAIGKHANVFLNPRNARKHLLYFKATSSYVRPQKTDIYIDSRYVGTKTIGSMQTYTLKIPFSLRKGLNIVSFRFKKPFVPARVYAGNKDRRALSAFFNEIQLKPTTSLPDGSLFEHSLGSNKNIFFISTGWSFGEKKGRWLIDNNAYALLHAPKNNTKKLYLKVLSLAENQRLKIFVDGVYIKTIRPTDRITAYEILLLKPLKKGLVIIEFEATRFIRPANEWEGTKDKRRLFVFFEEIKFAQ